jgi:tripartite-type tricarboxylate transporter receptor subunit TctC
MSVPRITVPALAALALAALAVTTGAAAQYPSQPIRLLVPIPPGGGPDVVARLVGQRLGEVFRQPVVVENRPASNGVLATELTAKAAPDGYTLLLGPEGMVVINPHLYPRMSINPIKELVPVASVFRSNFVMAVNAALPVRNFHEFVELARKSSPSLSYASGGNGSQHQLIMEMVKSRAGIELLHVPYKGGAPATTAAVAGDVAVLFAGPSIVAQIKSGKLRALAVSGEKRSPAFPDLPALGEIYPGAGINPWAALYAPAATPRAIVARLHAEVNRVLAQPAVAERFDAVGGIEPFITSPEELAALLQSQYALYGKIIRAVGVTLD